MRNSKGFALFLGLILIFLGFILGRVSKTPEATIQYIKGETIIDSIPKPYPVYVSVPETPELPMKPDTIWMEGEIINIHQVVDTLQIIAEFIKKNTYEETLFDNDTLGKFILGLDVQYNQVQGIRYEFTPMTRQVTTRGRFTPFVTGSINSFGYIGTGGGLFVRDWGLGYKFLVGTEDRTGHEFSLYYRIK